MNKTLHTLCTALAVLTLGAGAASADFNGPSIAVKVTNVTRSVLLTPPVIAVSRREIPYFQIGQEPSQAVADLAEGGATGGVAEIFMDEDAYVIQDDTPLMPGESRIYHLPKIGARYLSFGSMLLPTNDGFTGFSVRLKDLEGGKGFPAYDAGAEENTESCADIPGPQCGGEAFSDGLAEGYVTPHPGISGENELSGLLYNWTDPVLWVEYAPFGFDE